MNGYTLTGCNECYLYTGFFILYLSIILRQHYAPGNQNQMVGLEFRLRYFELFGSRSKAVEDRLFFSRIAALQNILFS